MRRAFLQSADIVYELSGEVTLVGRSPRADVVLPSRSVSGKHAELVVQLPGPHERVGHALVRDLGSRNGTFVNDKRISYAEYELRTGDIVRFGYEAHCYLFALPERNAQGTLAAPDFDPQQFEARAAALWPGRIDREGKGGGKEAGNPRQAPAEPAGVDPRSRPPMANNSLPVDDSSRLDSGAAPSSRHRVGMGRIARTQPGHQEGGEEAVAFWAEIGDGSYNPRPDLAQTHPEFYASVPPPRAGHDGDQDHVSVISDEHGDPESWTATTQPAALVSTREPLVSTQVAEGDRSVASTEATEADMMYPDWAHDVVIAPPDAVSSLADMSSPPDIYDDLDRPCTPPGHVSADGSVSDVDGQANDDDLAPNDDDPVQDSGDLVQGDDDDLGDAGEEMQVEEASEVEVEETSEVEVEEASEVEVEGGNEGEGVVDGDVDGNEVALDEVGDGVWDGVGDGSDDGLDDGSDDGLDDSLDDGVDGDTLPDAQTLPPDAQAESREFEEDSLLEYFIVHSEDEVGGPQPPVVAQRVTSHTQTVPVEVIDVSTNTIAKPQHTSRAPRPTDDRDWVVVVEDARARAAAAEAELARVQNALGPDGRSLPEVSVLLERLEAAPRQWTALRNNLKQAHLQIEILSSQLENTLSGLHNTAGQGGDPGATIAELQSQVALLTAENKALSQAASLASAPRSHVQVLQDKLAQADAEGGIQAATRQAQVIADLRRELAALR